MKLYRQLRSVFGILYSRVTKRPVPVAVRWNLLYRCPNRCVYCSLWKQPCEELSTAQIVPRLTEFARLGTTRISFSGGEPLLRKDIGRLVDAAAGQGISPTMNTSGYGLSRHIDELRGLDLLKISLDGPPEVHDRVRGKKGAHRVAMDAAELGRRRLKKISFSTTITSFNVHRLDYMLEMAQRFDTVVAFQPLKTLYRGVEDIADVAPSPEDMRRAVDQLIREKKAGQRGIRNSLAELEFMRDWPRFPSLACGAGKIFVMVNPQGTLLPCDRITYDIPLPNLLQMPVGEAIRKLPAVQCAGCAFCGSLQLNLVYSSTTWPIREVLRLVN